MDAFFLVYFICKFIILKIVLYYDRKKINSSFYLKRFPLCFNLFVPPFPVTPCLAVVVQSCMEWICDIVIYADDTTLYSECDWVCDQWQQLELASELESDLQDMVDWGKKWLVDLNAGKTQLVSFDWSNNGSVDVKVGGSTLEEKSSFKLLCLTFSSKLDWGLTLSVLLKLPPRKLEL